MSTNLAETRHEKKAMAKRWYIVHAYTNFERKVADAIKALLAAKRPVIYAGQGVLWAEASDELREFAELVNVPVMTTNTGKSAFPENHALALGTGAGTMTKMVRHFLDRADLVFGIGCSFTTNLASAGIPPGKVLVMCTVDTKDLNKEQQLHHAVVGDARLVLRQLIEEPGSRQAPMAAEETVRWKPR